jgi:hypothetical protein
VGPRGPRPQPETPLPIPAIGGLVLLMAMLLRSRAFGRQGRWAMRLAPALVLLLLVVTWTACVSNPPPAFPNKPTTPAGVYQIQLVATAPGPGGVAVKQTVTLTVHVL